MLQGFLGRRGGLSFVSMGTIGTGRLLRAPKRETWHRFLGTWLLVGSLKDEKMPKSSSPIVQEGTFPGMLGTPDSFFHPQILLLEIWGRSRDWPESLKLGKCDVLAPARKVSTLQGL